MAQRTSNELLLDAMIRHQTYLMRYSSGVRNRVNALLQRSEPDIVRLIHERLRDGEGLSSASNVRRLQSLLAAITGIRQKAWTQSGDFLLEQMQELGYQEPLFMQGVIGTVAPVVVTTVLPSARTLRAIATSNPFEGQVLKDWAATMEADDLRRIRSAVQLGMVAGESNAQIARRLVGTDGLNGEDGVTHMTRRQVEAITRTAVNHVSNAARDEFMRENADIIASETYVATLDARTTAVCKANDGKQFPVGVGPRPPLHFNCRSLRVATLDGEALSGRPYKASTTKQLLREFSDQQGIPRVTTREALPRGSKGAYDEFARKRVRELTGRVPASTSYQVWLKGQTRTFQEDTLGVTKAKLFRDGGLTLDKFVAANGTELTLGQLAAKHASAFRAAGLDPKGFI
jgi:SPP1 gp7 family putative phage head morphogenesis protein